MSKTYVEVSLKPHPFEPWNEIIVAQLGELPYESFVEENETVLAYISEDDFDESVLVTQVENLKNAGLIDIFCSWKIIPANNWNAVWESQFEPVFVDAKLLIKAPFHHIDFQGLTIEIEPKMSFGTGHHQTTFLMCSEMMEMPWTEKNVLDMGAGTGVLAILAEKLGAAKIIAVEIEEWSAENCAYNAQMNDCSKIKSFHGGKELLDNARFDIILANINKNVLRDQMTTYSDILDSKGFLLLSGFFVSDNEELIALATSVGLLFVKYSAKDNWSLLKFQKP
jgi:ribosomal protein L11 methyltransferase